MARSTTLPRRTNALNSLIIGLPPSQVGEPFRCRSGRLAGGAPVGGAGLFPLAAGLDARAALAAGLAGALVDPVLVHVWLAHRARSHEIGSGAYQRLELVVGELLALGPRVAVLE